MHIIASTFHHTNWYCGGALLNRMFRLSIFLKIPVIGKRQHYKTFNRTYFYHLNPNLTTLI